MTEKRQFPRYSCNLKTKFLYYMGNPEEIDINTSVPKKGKGLILDICSGGVFIITNEKVTIGIPIKVNFSIKKNKYNMSGKIVRTGLLKNNPSELVQKYSKLAIKKDSYIAVEFTEKIADFSDEYL